MSLGYHINADEGIITINGSEQVALSEVQDLGTNLLRDEMFDPMLPQLVDLRGLELSFSAQEATHFSAFILNHYVPASAASIAIVVDGSIEDKRLASIYRLCCQMERSELFDHYDQALKWLMRREFVA